jgi:hypothetical protein
MRCPKVECRSLAQLRETVRTYKFPLSGCVNVALLNLREKPGTNSTDYSRNLTHQQHPAPIRVNICEEGFRMKQLLAFTVFALCPLWAQQPTSPAMNMPAHDMQAMPGMDDDGASHAMSSMEGHHMDMGPHMKMTPMRALQPGDQEKADQVVQAARRAAEKYTDYKVALADGFKIFMPDRPQKQYHFTNYKYGFEAAFSFNPDHPTSLLYEKTGEGYKLIGVMYTARKTATLEDLDARVPLSIAQWHAHVNLCLPPAEQMEAGKPNSQFGFHGSITTQAECDAVGGRFMPQVFGWMVHVYPFAEKQEDIWSVERQAHEHMD